jgi:hypothetical protein
VVWAKPCRSIGLQQGALSRVFHFKVLEGVAVAKPRAVPFEMEIGKGRPAGKMIPKPLVQSVLSAWSSPDVYDSALWITDCIYAASVWCRESLAGLRKWESRPPSQLLEKANYNVTLVHLQFSISPRFGVGLTCSYC